MRVVLSKPNHDDVVSEDTRDDFARHLGDENGRPHEKCQNEHGEWAALGNANFLGVTDAIASTNGVVDEKLVVIPQVSLDDFVRHASKPKDLGGKSSTDLVKTLLDVDSSTRDGVASESGILKSKSHQPPSILGTLTRHPRMHLIAHPLANPGVKLPKPGCGPLAVYSGKYEQGSVVSGVGGSLARLLLQKDSVTMKHALGPVGSSFNGIEKGSEKDKHVCRKYGKVLGVDAIQASSSVLAIGANVLEGLPIEVVDIVLVVVVDVVTVCVDELLCMLFKVTNVALINFGVSAPGNGINLERGRGKRTNGLELRANLVAFEYLHGWSSIVAQKLVGLLVGIVLEKGVVVCVANLLLVEANGFLVLLLPSLAKLDKCEEVAALVGLVVADDVVDGQVGFIGVVKVFVNVLHGFNVESEHEHVTPNVSRFGPNLFESLCPLLKATNLGV